MWANQTHLLIPLTTLMSNKLTFKWTDVEQKCFEDIKHIVTHDTLLLFLYLNGSFDIHTNASYYHLVAVVGHKVKLIVFYSHKLMGPQKRYIVKKRHFISIVKTLKIFCTILLCQQFKMYTNPKKNT